MIVQFMLVLFSVFIFFFKQKTAYEMRISDWSSDVCSSDLPRAEQCACGRRTERDDPLLRALAEHPHGPPREIEVREVESDELAHPNPRRVEELDDREVDRKSVV